MSCQNLMLLCDDVSEQGYMYVCMYVCVCEREINWWIDNCENKCHKQYFYQFLVTPLIVFAPMIPTDANALVLRITYTVFRYFVNLHFVFGIQIIHGIGLFFIFYFYLHFEKILIAISAVYVLKSKFNDFYGFNNAAPFLLKMFVCDWKTGGHIAVTIACYCLAFILLMLYCSVHSIDFDSELIVLSSSFICQ